MTVSNSWIRAGVLLLASAVALLGWGSAAAIELTPKIGAPPASIGLYPGSGEVRVTWADPRYGDGYISHIQVDAQPRDGSCTASPGSGGCTVTGLKNGTAYTFAVFAVGVNGFNYNAAVAGPAWPCCSPPEAPTSVAAVAEQGAAVVSWEPPSNAQAAGNEFTYSVTSSPTGGTCSTSERSCRIEGLEDGTGHVFSVVASNAVGSSAAGVSNAVTPKGPPGAPSGVQVFLGKRGKATVSWLGPAKTGGEVVSQYVAIAQPGGAACRSAGQLSCTVKGLSNGKRYRFTVTAYNSVGAGPRSEVSPIARPLAGPGKVRRIKARGSGTSATITWKPPKSTGGLAIRRYEVRSSPSGSMCRSKTTKCTVKGLTPGTRYTFTVQAINRLGKGAVAESSAVTIAQPQAPTQPTQPPVPDKPEKPSVPLS